MPVVQVSPRVAGRPEVEFGDADKEYGSVLKDAEEHHYGAEGVEVVKAVHQAFRAAGYQGLDWSA